MPDRLADDRPQQGLLQRVRRFLHDDLISSFKKELDDLVMDAHAQARDEIRRVLDMAVTHSEERVRVTIEELARPLREKEQGALEAFSAELIGRRSRELEAQVHATRAEIERLLEQERETLRARVEADVRSAVDKARQSCDQQVEEASAAVSKAGEIADRTLQKRTARLEDFGREFESGLLERQRTRLLELSASGLEGFRASAETLLQKLRDEAQSSLATLVERVDEDHGSRIRTRSEELSATWIDQLQRQAQETTLKLQEQMEARSRTVAQQDEAVKQQFEYLEARAQAALDSINRWFEERCLQMQALTEEDIRTALEKTRQAWNQEVQKASTLIANATVTVNLTFETGTARLQALSQQLESGLDLVVEKRRARLEELSASRLEDLRRNTEALMHAMKGQAEATLQESVDKASEEFANRVRASSRDLLGTWSDQIQREAQDAGLKLREQIEDSARAVEEQNQRRLAAVETISGLFRQHAQNAVETFRTGLQSTLQEYRETRAREFENRLQGVERHHGAFRDQLRKEIEMAAEEAMAGVKKRMDQVSGEISETVYKQIGMATVAVKQLTDQAQSAIQEELQKSIESSSAEIRGLADANLEDLKRRAGTVVEDLHTRLEQAARLVYGEPGASRGGRGAAADQTP